MVLGLRTKAQKGPSLQLDYIVHIHEVKPWPPSQSLRTLRAVLIQWEHGDRTSGFTNQAVPSLGAGSGVGDGRIEFNESFRLRLTLMREMSVKDTYHKNCIQFNLYEPRRDNALKGQLVGSAVLDLAAYGVIKENLSITTPINCKRTYSNSAQPLLSLKIQPVETSRTSSSSRDRNHGESVSALMSEEYAEEAEIASFTTDDDVSSHSSLAVTSSAADLSGSSSPFNKKIETTAVNGSAKNDHVPHLIVVKPDEEQEQANESHPNSAGNSSRSSSMELSSDIAWISKRIAKETDKRHSSSHLDEKNASSTSAEGLLMAGRSNFPLNGCTDNETRESHQQRVEEEKGQEVYMQKRVTLENDLVSSTRESFSRSFRSSLESSKSSGPTRGNHSLATDTCSRKDAKASRKETRNLVSEGRIQHLENRIKMLEGELREAAALEVSLYSVVAEHGSSVNKVHAPARRLSRLYFHANKKNPKSGRASASKSVVSGLVLVAKACGNDVPRLTFWLSNSIVLRAIISKSSELGNCEKKGKKKSSQENPVTFVAALEKVESWIFSRIVESLWWQTFTPHMQLGVRTSNDSDRSKSYKRRSSWMEQQQGNFSVELWKKAFSDACERICPVRGEGHDCGCLPLLSRLIMEQLVARLDVAMFNAILRESADEIPTDPIADPISDANVLPIRAGKASFGGGAQLKNAIGNWSRWLTHLFGMDEDLDENEITSSKPKPFCLLNELSDLMMLPKDMLLSPSIRKEVCPAFGLPLLTRILISFVPDEFCPDPIPAAVLEALNTEDPLDSEDCSIVHVPCEAAPIVYHTPSVDSVAAITHSKSKLALLKKSQTSDDELDQLNSPLKAIIRSSLHTAANGTPTPTSSPITVRYQLLREVWKE